MEIPESGRREDDRAAMQSSLARMLEWLDKIIDAGCDEDCPCGSGHKCAAIAEEAKEAIVEGAVTVDVF